jgi:hypothetical protein
MKYGYGPGAYGSAYVDDGESYVEVPLREPSLSLDEAPEFEPVELGEDSGYGPGSYGAEFDDPESLDSDEEF